MQISKIMVSNYTDALFTKYSLLDADGYLVGTDDENIKSLYSRIEELSNKPELTDAEIVEGEELTEVNRAYMKEVNKYLLHEATKGDSKTDSEDEDYNDDDNDRSVHSDNLSFEEGSEESSDTA